MELQGKMSRTSLKETILPTATIQRPSVNTFEAFDRAVNQFLAS